MKRSLGTAQVSPIGLGCMNFCWAYGPPLAEAEVEQLLLAALDGGVDHLDTAALYGFGASETLIGKLLNARGHRQRFQLASKGGMAGETFPDGVKRVIDGRPETIRRHCDASLQRLQTDVIDLYYLHRWDKSVPIEDSVGAMAELLREGKVRALGLSEVSAATLRRAHAVHPIAAVQTEYSLWTRNPEIAVLDACRELGAAFVAFSPVGRGFLTDALPDAAALDVKDIRRQMPRFAAPHWPANVALREQLLAVAQRLGLSLAQLSLAWVLARGEHVHVIPGTSRIAHLHDNLGAAQVRLSPAILAELDALMAPDAIHGPRYSAQSTAEVDTETFG